MQAGKSQEEPTFCKRLTQVENVHSSATDILPRQIDFELWVSRGAKIHKGKHWHWIVFLKPVWACWANGQSSNLKSHINLQSLINSLFSIENRPPWCYFYSLSHGFHHEGTISFAFVFKELDSILFLTCHSLIFFCRKYSNVHLISTYKAITCSVVFSV